MKKITFNFLTIFTLLFATSTLAQTRYLDPVFSPTKTDSFVEYATNISVLLNDTLPIPTGTDSIPIGVDSTTGTPIYFNMPKLDLDVYEPAGDTATERPLIIYLHTGTFLPIIRNQGATGSRFDYATQAMCQQFAARGYVVANTDYRMGWNPFLPTEPERAASLMKAAYRGIQDVRSAIRFFRKSYTDMNNPYGIDTSRIIICGQGTGGWIATCLNSVDDTSELFLPKFLDPVTATPLIHPAVFGDWFGFGGNPLLNIDNHVGYSSDHDMVLNMGGAIGDLSWLEAGDKPMVAAHCNTDRVAIFGTGNLSTLGVQIVSDISGSYDVMHKADMLGNNDMVPVLYDDYTIAGKQNFAKLIASNAVDADSNLISSPVDNLFPLITGNPAEGAPWDYFDSTIAVGAALAQGLPAAQGYAAYQGSLNTNPDVSLAKATAYQDTVLNFFCPRIVNTLMLPGNTVGIQNEKISVNVYPNPTSDFISFYSSTNIKSISIFDNNGKLIERINPNRFTFTMDLRFYAKGIYYAEISNDNQIKTEKIILK